MTSNYHDDDSDIPRHAVELIPHVFHWKNKKNRFSVLWTHYLADPTKRDPEWANVRLKSMGPAAFNLHYNIQWKALGGQKVFGEIADLWDKISFEPFEMPDHWKRVAGLDWGINHPAAQLFGAIDEHGILWIYRDFKRSDIRIHQFARMLADSDEFSKLSAVVYDPSMRKRDQSTVDGNVSILQLLVNNLQSLGKKAPLVPGRNSESVGIERFRELVITDPPRIRISTACVALKKELFNLEYQRLSEKTLLTHNPSEKIVDKHNDLWDCLKYIVLAYATPATEPDTRMAKIEKIADPWLRGFWERIYRPPQQAITLRAYR